MTSHHRLRVSGKWIFILLAGAGVLFAGESRPFPQTGRTPANGLLPDNLSPAQMNSAVTNAWFVWKQKYLAPSVKVSGDFKVNFDSKGTTVSEAMGYGMLLAAYFAGADPEARKCFDGLNRFRKRYPSKFNPTLMCWKVPASEAPTRDDAAADGDIDMAFALLLAHEQWRDAAYLVEATNLVQAIAHSLVRPDFSLRLGDWNDKPGQTRPSDIMPTHFRAFYAATGDGFWTNVESKCYAMIEELQTNFAPATGLVPDFAVAEAGRWKPAKPGFLEGPHDGEFNYNACRVPWRIGWAAVGTGDARALRAVERFMAWASARAKEPARFKAGYRLDGTDSDNNNFDTVCFIAPTGVAAMATRRQTWLNEAFGYAAKRREKYYEDSVSLLSMLVMSGNAWLPGCTPVKGGG